MITETSEVYDMHQFFRGAFRITTETSEARSDNCQVFGYIIKQLWTFQLLYMMFDMYRKIIIDLGYRLGQ